MKQLALTLLLCIAAMTPSSLFLSRVPAQNRRIVTARQVNGTWRASDGTLKVQALGNQRLKVEFSGLWWYDTPGGRMVNTGEATGVARIEADTAVFVPDGAEEYGEQCRIMMKFTTRGTLVVRQEGLCGFGLNVTATGTYRRVSSSRPKFDDDLASEAAGSTASGEKLMSLVANLYKVHSKNYQVIFGGEGGKEYLAGYFDEKLAGLILKNALETPRGDVGRLEFDPLFAAQDTQITKFQVGQAKIDGDRAVVIVSFNNFDQKEIIKFDLHNTKTGWRIANLVYSDGSNLVEILSAPLP